MRSSVAIARHLVYAPLVLAARAPRLVAAFPRPPPVSLQPSSGRPYGVPARVADAPYSQNSTSSPPAPTLRRSEAGAGVPVARAAAIVTTP